MSEQTVRGYMLSSTVKYLDKTYDEQARAQIKDDINPRVRTLMGNIDNLAWYPKEDISEMFKAIAKHHQRTDGNVREALVGVGLSIGEMATTTFLKLVMKLLTPRLFVSKLPDFWRRDHRFGELTAAKFDTEGRHAKVTLAQIGGYDYIAPVGVGFIKFALDGVFKYKNIRATYDWTVEAPGPDEVTFDFRWD